MHERGLRTFTLTVLFVNLAANVTYAVLSINLARIGASLASDAILLPEAYAVGVACTVALTPSLLATWGAPRTLQISLCGLIVTSGMAALSSSISTLRAALFLHGLFAAPMLPITQTLCATRTTDASQRARLGSYWVATSLLAITLGYTLGGWCSDHLGWRLALLMCWGPALVSLPLVHRLGAAQTKASPASPGTDESGKGPLDLAGALLLALALISLTSLLAPMAEGAVRSAAHTRRLIMQVGIAVTALWAQERRAPRAVLDFSILTDMRVTGALVCTFLVDASSTGMFQSEMLGEVLHLDPEWLGIRSALGGGAMLVGVGIANRLLRMRSAPVAAAGAVAVLLIGKIGYLDYGPHASLVTVLWPAVVSSVGYGMLATVLAVNVCSNPDVRRSAAAAALYAVAVQMGASVGMASLDSALQSQLTKQAAPTQALLVQAYTHVFVLEAAVALLVLPFLLLLRPSAPHHRGSVD